MTRNAADNYSPLELNELDNTFSLFSKTYSCRKGSQRNFSESIHDSSAFLAARGASSELWLAAHTPIFRIRTHPVLGRASGLAVVRRDPEAVEVLEQLGTVFHPHGVVVEGRAIPYKKFREGMGRGIIEGQEAL